MPIHQDSPAASQQRGADLNRRSVLRGFGGVAAVAAGAGLIGADALAQQPASTKTPAAAPDATNPDHPGYHLTAHIRAYYRTTRF